MDPRACHYNKETKEKTHRAENLQTKNCTKTYQVVHGVSVLALELVCPGAGYFWREEGLGLGCSHVGC